MDVGKETTDQPPTEKGQQDKEEGGISGKKGEYAENPVAQKVKPGASGDKHNGSTFTQAYRGLMQARSRF